MTPQDNADAPDDVLSITDEEWIAASQACCGHDPDDDPPATSALPPETP